MQKTIEELFKKNIEQFKEQFKEQLNEQFEEVYGDFTAKYLPYVEQDVGYNAFDSAIEIVRSLLDGKNEYKWLLEKYDIHDTINNILGKMSERELEKLYARKLTILTNERDYYKNLTGHLEEGLGHHE